MAATIWCTPVPLYPWQALVLRGLNLDLSRSRPYFGYSSSLLQHCQHSPAEMKSSQACESSTHLHHRALSCKPLRQNSIQFNSIQFNPAQFVQLSSASHLSGSHQCARHHWGLNVCRMVYRCVQMRIVKQIILRRGIPLCSAEVLNRRCHGLFCRLCVRQTSEVFVRLRGEGETKKGSGEGRESGVHRLGWRFGSERVLQMRNRCSCREACRRLSSVCTPWTKNACARTKNRPRTDTNTHMCGVTDTKT
jgi:hypothetical protein